MSQPKPEANIRAADALLPEEKKTVVITGGGTGGHVFPALAIADEFQRRGYALRYVGTAHGMEAKLVPEKKIPFFTLRTGAVKNQSPLKILHTLFQLLGAVVWSLGFLRREKPLAVVGVGGYVSVPICLAAFLLRYPLYLQEQNTSVGIANRFLGKLSRKIFLGFPEAARFFPKGKTLYTGNPLRREFFDPGVPPLNPNSQTLLILGGSQGAKTVNDAIVELLPRLKSQFPDLTVLHQTGARDYEAVKAKYDKAGLSHCEAHAFIREMPAFYAKASLVISRSGALTVAELIQVGRPAILVPYPRQGQNDQVDNARLLEKAGAGKMVEQGPAFAERLWNAILETFPPERLRQMSEGYSQLRTQGAIVSIADHIEADLR